MPAIFANPFVVKLWKNLWQLSQYGEIRSGFKEDDYYKIVEISRTIREKPIGQQYLLKALRADTTISYFGTSTLNALCEVLNTLIPENKIPTTWVEFSRSQKGHKTFKDCQALDSQLYIGKKLNEVKPELFSRINKRASKKAKIILNYEGSEVNIPQANSEHIKRRVIVAQEEDVQKIYDFAIGRYDDCPINGPEIKLPWWKKNPYIFYIVKDNADKVIANINVLPLRENTYFKIRKGTIDERDIKADNIIAPIDKHYVSYLYIEGFNCLTESLFSKFLYSFLSIASKLADIEKGDIIIGAIGGTDEGEELMTGLGFEIATFAEDRKDNLDFYEINLRKAIWLLYEI